MKSGTLVILLLFITPGLHSQVKDNRAKTVEAVSYCELFRNLDRYSKKQIRLKATWTYGFEWSYLSDRECLDQPKAMVELADADDLCAASKSNLKKINHKRFDNKAEITVVGELRDCGGCGHMSGYRY